MSIRKACSSPSPLIAGREKENRQRPGMSSPATLGHRARREQETRRSLGASGQIAVSHPCRNQAGVGTIEVSTAASRFEFPLSFQKRCTPENQRTAA